MVGVVNEICLGSGVRRKRLSLINQDGVIDGEMGESSNKTNKQLPARQSCIQMSVSLLLIAGTLQENHANVADSKIDRPALAYTYLDDFAAPLTHFPEIFISRKNDPLIWGERRFSSMAGGGEAARASPTHNHH